MCIMNDMMQFMEELKELCHKGEQIVHHMQGDNFGQRRYRYGMRDGQSSYGSGNYSGGGYGQRWDNPMQGGYHSQYPDINPMMFM